MSRIEQQTNGSYVRKLEPLELKIIRRLYQEVSERKEENDELEKLIDQLRDIVIATDDVLKVIKMKVDDIQKKLNDSIFNSANEAILDRNLTVQGYITATFFRATVTSGPSIETQSRDLNPNFNAEFLQGKTPADFAPASHVGKGGSEHALANPMSAGFMSSAEHSKLKEFGPASTYATVQELNNHIGSGGDAHAVATQGQAGFMSATDKQILDQLPLDVQDIVNELILKAKATPTQDGFMTKEDKIILDNVPNEYVKKLGDVLRGVFTFTESANGFRWESTVNRGSDAARIEYISDDTGASGEDSTLYIEVVNDGYGPSGPDRIVIGTLSEDTQPASEVRIRTIKRNGTYDGGKIVLETDRVEASNVVKGQTMEMQNMIFQGMPVDYVRVVGAGLDGRPGEAGCWINGVPYGAQFRGWNVICYDRATRRVEWANSYDTHGNGSGTGSTPANEIIRLTNDLNSLNQNKVVIIYGYDQPSFENLNGGGPAPTAAQIDAAIKALKRCGASNVVQNMPYRASYSLIGIPTIGEGNGMEQFGYPDPTEMSTLIFAGNPMGLQYGGGGAANAPAPNEVIHGYNSGYINDRTQVADTVPSGQTAQAIRAEVELWNTSMTSLLGRATVTKGVTTWQGIILEDTHTRTIKFDLNPTGLVITSENACYALGATDVTHVVSYKAKVIFHYS